MRTYVKICRVVHSQPCTLHKKSRGEKRQMLRWDKFSSILCLSWQNSDSSESLLTRAKYASDTVGLKWGRFHTLFVLFSDVLGTVTMPPFLLSCNSTVPVDCFLFFTRTKGVSVRRTKRITLTATYDVYMYLLEKDVVHMRKLKGRKKNEIPSMMMLMMIMTKNCFARVFSCLHVMCFVFAGESARAPLSSTFCH